MCPYSRVIYNVYHYHLGNCILMSHPKRGDSIPKLVYTGNQTLFSPLTVTSPLKMEARIGSVRRQTSLNACQCNLGMMHVGLHHNKPSGPWWSLSTFITLLKFLFTFHSFSSRWSLFPRRSLWSSKLSLISLWTNRTRRT